jgi:hypothetical protein
MMLLSVHNIHINNNSIKGSYYRQLFLLSRRPTAIAAVAAKPGFTHKLTLASFINDLAKIDRLQAPGDTIIAVVPDYISHTAFRHGLFLHWLH